ncbi:zinc ribbon domain-containing protein [Thomasclavelia sp.]|uniref:zinc ribbon domain-containing protein n=1 Tax=Thomasclavelia sp. TaxID=3025757 RepID=UPI0025E5E9DA|nr:zinc ribbon domain-containing protein [Thomasclavelia sp.]
MIKCKKCGSELDETFLFCPECGTKIEKETVKEKSYWFDLKIWAVFLALVLITIPMDMYLDYLAMENKVANKTSQETNKDIESLENSEYSLATNRNNLGVSYFNDNGSYIMINDQVIKFNDDYSNQELVVDEYVTSFSEDDDYYYYLDSNNDYIRMDKKERKSDKLLENVYYVQNLGELVYYQNDSDNESIHCLNLTNNEDKKINDEVSYCLIVDQSKERIFYVNKENKLISIALDGSDLKIISENAGLYTYDGNDLYFINDKGIVKSDLDGNDQLIYENQDLEMINFLGDKLIVQGGAFIYQIDKDGKNAKEIYKSDSDMSFEIVGSRLLVLSTDSISGIKYEIVDLDGNVKEITNQGSLLNQGEV